MKKQTLFLYFNLLLCCACYPLDSTVIDFRSVVVNRSGKKIKMELYRRGEVASPELAWVENGLTKEVFRSMEGASYAVELSSLGIDSVVVHYHDGVKAVHYGFGSTGVNPKAIQHQHARSLFNHSSWLKIISVDKKRRKEGSFTYTFTEQDYLEAKK